MGEGGDDDVEEQRRQYQNDDDESSELTATTKPAVSSSKSKTALYLTPEERIERLKEFGVTENEMNEAIEEVQRVQRDREESGKPKRFVVVATAVKPTPKRNAASPQFPMRRRRAWRRATTKSRSASGPSENNSIGTRRAINKYRKYTAAVVESSKTRITTE